jgi:hypothetical protein
MPSPTPEEIQREQERLELIQKQNAAAKELASTYEKMAKSSKKLTDEEKEILDISKKISKSATEIEKSTNKRLDKTSSVKELSKSIQALEFSQLKNADVANKLEKERKAALTSSMALTRDARNQRKSIVDLEGAISEKIALRNAAEANNEKETATRLAREIKEETRILQQKEKQFEKTKQQAQSQRDLAKQIDETKQAHQTVIEEQKKEIELTKQEVKLRHQKSILDALGEKFDIKKIKDMITLGGLFKVLLESALKFNEISVQISKNLGYSASEANRVTENLVKVASNSGNINVTLQNAGEAMSELNNATGLVAEYSADTLETQIMLTKQFGLQADEAAGIYKLSVLNNKSASDTNKEMVSAFVAARNQFKVGANFKQVMAEAAKVSGQLAANLGYNPERITKAVVAMKAFGTTLEQTKAQGAALLDFASSLENELQAELLTGQQLNLERARAAALAGDQVALAEELANQGMTLEKFSSMNVLAQESYAKALGLSADQLSDQLQKQKQAQESGKSLAQLTEEEALEAQKRQTIQEKFNNSILKLQDLVGNLVSGPFAGLLDILSSIFSLTGYILQPFAQLANFIKESTAASLTFLGVLGAIYAMKNRTFLIQKGELALAAVKKTYQASEIGQLGIIQTIKSKGFFKTLAEAAMAAFRSVAAIPFVGPVLGAAAAATAVGLGMKLFSKGDDVISPGYGKRVLSTPEGSIALNNKDTIVAGTDLGGGESMGPSIDLTPMITAINEVKVAIDRLYSKDTSVNMDGKKVGTTLTQGSYKVA